MDRRREISLFAVSGALLALFALLSLKCGIMDISWSEVGEIFTGADGSRGEILRELRLARTLLAMLSGAAFAVSGVILQKVLHNDLASPDILGISGGAGLAGITLLLIFPRWSGYLNAVAFAGAMSAALLIYLAAWKRRLSPVRLILAGVAFGALFSTAGSAVILANSDKLTGVMEFTIGGFSARNMADLRAAAPFFAASFLLAALLPRRLDMLSLGRDDAVALGLDVERNRLAALAVAALAAATAVSVSGLLGFVGLMAPHLAARLLGSCRGAPLMTLSPLIGALLTLGGDLLGRTLFSPRELPAGLFLSAAGALFFLLLLLKKQEEP